MIRAFAAALEDENLLVRRSALDILLQSIRVDGFAVRKAHAEDRAILMRAATGVVLRRDLSLNRRLYTWLLGPEEKSENQISFLRDNALGLLSGTLKVSFQPLQACFFAGVLTVIDNDSGRLRWSRLQESMRSQGRSRFLFRCWTSGRLGRL